MNHYHRYLRRGFEAAIFATILVVIVWLLMMSRPSVSGEQGKSVEVAAASAIATSTGSDPTPTRIDRPPVIPGEPTPMPMLPTLDITPVPTWSAEDAERSERERLSLPTSPPLPTPAPNDPIQFTIIVDGDSNTIPLAQGSTIIALGTVRKVAAPRWTTADGLRPPDTSPRKNTASIVTPVVIDVTRYLKGQQPQGQLVVWAWGGTIGRDSFKWESDTRHTFFEGERVVIFLEPRDGTDDGNPVWENMQHYTIMQDGLAKNSYRTLRLDSLLAEIKDATLRSTPVR